MYKIFLVLLQFIKYFSFFSVTFLSDSRVSCCNITETNSTSTIHLLPVTIIMNAVFYTVMND